MTTDVDFRHHVRTFVDLSTGHLHSATREALANRDGLLDECLSYGAWDVYGWFMYVTDDEYLLDQLQERFAELVVLLKIIKAQGYDYVRFDRDQIQHPALPFFD